MKQLTLQQNRSQCPGQLNHLIRRHGSLTFETDKALYGGINGLC